MSACLPAHSDHDDVSNFTGVERSKHCSYWCTVGYICLRMQITKGNENK